MDGALRPFFRRKCLLTKTEKDFYQVLRSVVDNHTVWTTVRLADLAGADKRHLLRKSTFEARHIAIDQCATMQCSKNLTALSGQDCKAPGAQ